MTTDTKKPFPKVGNLAPAFTLPNQAGEKISLKDFKGKSHVVLYFYPKAMTPGCTVQACGLRDTQKALAKLGAVAIGISPDSSARLAKFEEKHELNFQLLADEEHAVADAYGAWGLKKFMGKEYEGIYRHTYVIDEAGMIERVLEKVKTKEATEQVLELFEN